MAGRNGRGESPGRAYDQRRAVGDPRYPPRRQLPADDDLMPAPPGYHVVDPQPVASQPPAAVVTGPAGQPPEPVMGRFERDRRGAGPDGQAAYSGPPPGPERAPNLGRIRPIHLHGVVRGGGPLATADWPWLISRGAGVDQQRNPVHIHQAAEGVGVRVGWKRRRARRADVGEQVPAVGHGPHQSSGREHE